MLRRRQSSETEIRKSDGLSEIHERDFGKNLIC